ncbi:MAG: CCA tRNA nucleotidyltransferase [Chloroflexi bacterium]|nr:CCA tRNA nucleotidyltransferase [Chloroflexota bacterium]
MAELPPILMHLTPDQQRWVRAASSVARELGCEAYLVGGVVRDLVLGRESRDMDLTIEGDASRFAERLAERLGGEVVGRSQFMTYKISLGEAVLDVVTARRETYERPGALPSVSPGTLQDDLARRDFSINAMAVALDEEAWDRPIDPFNGRDDLREGLVRVLHSRSFVDDATRILRAVRYAARLGFRIEPGTGELLDRDLHHLDDISADRLRQEFELMLEESSLAAIVESAIGLGVLEAVHPSLEPGPAALNAIRRLDGEPPSDDRSLVAISVLTSGGTESDITSLAARLNLGSRWRTVIQDAMRLNGVVGSLARSQIANSELYEKLAIYDGAAIRSVMLASEDAMAVEMLALFLDELSLVEPELRGEDILAMGVEQGPAVGELLRKLKAARLDGAVTDRAGEERFVRELIDGGIS